MVAKEECISIPPVKPGGKKQTVSLILGRRWRQEFNEWEAAGEVVKNLKLGSTVCEYFQRIHYQGNKTCQKQNLSKSSKPKSLEDPTQKNLGVPVGSRKLPHTVLNPRGVWVK